MVLLQYNFRIGLGKERALAQETSKPDLQAIGNYDIVEKIAEGGMGAIYKARQRTSGQIVAVKVMPAHMAANPVLLQRFQQEFRAASLLNHPNIVRAPGIWHRGQNSVPGDGVR